MSLVVTGQFFTTSVIGLGASGTVSAPGVKVGDRIVLASSPANGLATNVNIFESIVTVDDEIQQPGGFGSATAGLTFEILGVRL